jgi:hypothetical protein
MNHVFSKGGDVKAERHMTMSEKSKRAIILAISTLLKGGMEIHRVVQYIHTTYCLNPEEAELLVSQAQTRLHMHYVA